MSWHAVDSSGRDLATGRAPRPPGWPTPAAALASAPAAVWPPAVVADDGRHVGLAEALGRGGDRVEALLAGLAKGPQEVAGVDIEALARATPAGPVSLPFALVALDEGAAVAEAVDPGWFAEVDGCRAELHRSLVAAGRVGEAEAALHVAMLVGTERLDPGDDTDVGAHVASGAQLWVLAGAVVSALSAPSGVAPDPFAAWGRLVVAGLWPIGPTGGRLVVSTGWRRRSPAQTVGDRPGSDRVARWGRE